MAKRTKNPHGNYFQKKDPNNEYRYDNDNKKSGGGYFYKNNDGSTYCQDGQGNSTYTDPNGKKHKK